MDKVALAKELVSLAKDITAADTFKCPECGTKVLENTGYCLKCKKKVKKASLQESELEDELNRLDDIVGMLLKCADNIRTIGVVEKDRDVAQFGKVLLECAANLQGEARKRSSLLRIL